MTRRTAIAIILAAGALLPARGQQPATAPGPEYVPGEIIVQYRPSVARGKRDGLAASRHASVLHRFDQLDIDHLQLGSGENEASALAAFKAMPDVVAVQPNYVRHAVASGPPNDPSWLNNSLWGLLQINVQSVWNTLGARGDGSVVVMDIDTGMNYNHVDLAANAWVNPGEIAGNGIDDDHDGYVDDVHGIDTVNHDSNPIDDNGHGTHTAGTIAAVGNNGVGVVGVNWNAKILPCKFLNAAGSGTDNGAIECLNYAVTLKTQHNINIRVTNNSWGGYRGTDDPTPLRNAFAAAGAAGIINFVAAGNDGLNIDLTANLFDPASLATVEPSIVAVAATDQSDNLAGFSNYGPNTVQLAAPGVSILSTWYSPGNTTYATASGTSMATPHVAGVAALLSSMDSSLTVAQLKALITNNVDVVPALGGKVATGGRLNAFTSASAVGGGGGGANAAVFVTTDTTTQGNWQGVYGADGYSIVGDATNLPAYAALGTTGALQYTWAASTSDPRALQRTTSGRVAATWYADPSFTLDVNTSGGTHQVVLYLLDWDSTIRSERVDVLDGGTNALLDTRTTSGFNGGKYLVWNVTGHVKLQVTKLTGVNTVVAAVFFGAGAPGNHPPTATLTGPPDNSSYGAPATVPLTATASDPDASDTIDHVTFFANGNSIGTATVPVAGVYSLSWPNVPAGNYALTAQSFDNHGTASAVSNTRNITVTGVGGGASAVFAATDTTTQGNWQGVYGGDGYSIVSDATSLPAYAILSAATASQYTWAGSTSDVRALSRVTSGRVAATWYATTFDLDVNITSGTHQVALYCLDWDSTSRSQGISVLDATSAAVLDTRNVTNFHSGQYLVWNVTGHVKFRVTQTGALNAVVSAVFFGAAGAPNTPPTSTLTGPPDNSSYTAPATVPLTATASDPDAGDTIDHVAFFANGNAIGTASVLIAGVYSFNWPNVPAGNYTLTAQSFDNHGAASAVSNARHVTVTGVGGGASAAFVTTDTTTQGNWQGAYGAEGYSIVSDATSLPAYAAVSAATALQYTWAGLTTDVRALSRVTGGRVAATWYQTTFDLDVNITSGTHRVALYCLDWDSTTRAQQIDVLDAVSSAVLDSRNVTNFHNGQYLVWNVSGHVKFRVTQTGALNAVISAVFFDPASVPAPEPAHASSDAGVAETAPGLRGRTWRER